MYISEGLYAIGQLAEQALEITAFLHAEKSQFADKKQACTWYLISRVRSCSMQIVKMSGMNQTQIMLIFDSEYQIKYGGTMYTALVACPDSAGTIEDTVRVLVVFMWKAFAVYVMHKKCYPKLWFSVK